MGLLQETQPALLEVPRQHGPLAGSLLRALIHEPAQVPAGDLGSLKLFLQPPRAELGDRDAPEHLLPSGNGRRGPE
eukprot:2469756-Alexandrium_andersonii.AAC.1